MSLINKTYFIGERNVPNTNAADVDSLLSYMITLREKEYLIAALGYELYQLFQTGLLAVAPDQRYLDILLGKDYTGYDNRKTRWEGLVSLTEEAPFIEVGLIANNDIFFKVGVTAGAPVDGDDTYVNPILVGKTFRVSQRGLGFLEFGVDIQKNSNGFTWLGGRKFSDEDTYNIQLLSASFDTSGVPVVPEAVSPICDYTYFYWLKKKATNTTGIGEKVSAGQNSANASPRHKQAQAWNCMVDRTYKLAEFLMVNIATYPEYQYQNGSKDLRLLLTKINPYF